MSEKTHTFLKFPLGVDSYLSLGYFPDEFLALQSCELVMNFCERVVPCYVANIHEEILDIRHRK